MEQEMAVTWPLVLVRSAPVVRAGTKLTVLPEGAGAADGARTGSGTRARMAFRVNQVHPHHTKIVAGGGDSLR